MNNDFNKLWCPVCNQNGFLIKHEATYVYSYIIDSDAPGLHNQQEFLPFLYDRREQKETKQFLECRTCGATFRCYFNQWDKTIGFKELQDAISANYLKESVNFHPTSECDCFSNIEHLLSEDL